MMRTCKHCRRPYNTNHYCRFVGRTVAYTDFSSEDFEHPPDAERAPVAAAPRDESKATPGQDESSEASYPEPDRSTVPEFGGGDSDDL